ASLRKEGTWLRRGSVPRDDRRLTPQELVVQAHARHVLFELQPGVDGKLTLRIAASRGVETKRLVIEVPQIKEEIFGLERPVVAERVFEAAAGGPAHPPDPAIAEELEVLKEEAIVGILDAGFALDVGDNRAAGGVQHPAIEREADASAVGREVV